MKSPLPIFDDIKHIDEHNFETVLIDACEATLQDYTRMHEHF